MSLSRRSFLKNAISSVTVPSLLSISCLRNKADSPAVRAITIGPNFHWFGYYDKHQFDITNRFVLSNQVDFEHRSPTPEDRIKVGMVDLKAKNKWTELGESTAWNWQQGCMLQWVPGSQSKVIWNDRQNGQFVSHIYDTQTGTKQTLPSSVYTLSSDGKTAMTPDFERIQDMRPGYGYAGIADPNKDQLRPSNTGIYKVDLLTGEKKLVISIEQIAQIPYPHEDLTDAKHYFNHLLFNPDGSRFIFLHRWRRPKGSQYKKVGGFGTRMLTATPDGEDIKVVDDVGFTSHFIWRGNEHILAWAKQPSLGNKFYLFKDRETNNSQAIGPDVMIRNGHCTYLPGNQWILNDTYPDEKRLQHVYLYHIESGERVAIGDFYSPPEYKGEWRVDTHPRISRDGKLVVIDSPHGGNGRQLYKIDISKFV